MSGKPSTVSSDSTHASTPISHAFDDNQFNSMVSNIITSPIFNHNIKQSVSNNTLNHNFYKQHVLDNTFDSMKSSNSIKKSYSSNALSFDYNSLNPQAPPFNSNHTYNNNNNNNNNASDILVTQHLNTAVQDLSLSNKQRARTLNDIQRNRSNNSTNSNNNINTYNTQLQNALINGFSTSNATNKLPSAQQLHTVINNSDTLSESLSTHEQLIDDNSRVLFVGDLARTVSEDELRHVFNTVGTVTIVDIKRDKITHNNLGYGFIHYATRQQAKDAKRELQNYELHGRRIRIGWAQKNTTLFIGDLDGKITSTELRSIFSQFGELNEDGTFVKDGSGKYGFVEYKQRADAELAKQHMNKQIVGTRAIRIGWGDNQVQKCCVHIQYDSTLGQHLIENDFRTLFDRFGYIVTITMPRTLQSHSNGKQSQINNKSYCFIHYSDTDAGEDAATDAIQQLQDCTLHGVQLHLSYGKRQIYSKHKKERDARNNNFMLHNDTRSIGSAQYSNATTNNSYQQHYNNNNNAARSKPLLNINHIDSNYLHHQPHHTYNNTYNHPMYSQSAQHHQSQYLNHYMQSPMTPQTQLHSNQSNTSNHFNFNIPSPAMTSMNDHPSPNVQPQPQFYLPSLDQTPALSAQPSPAFNLNLSSPAHHHHYSNSQQNYYLPSPSFITPINHTTLTRQASDTLSVLSQYHTPLFTPGYAPSTLYYQTSQPTLIPLTPAAHAVNNEHVTHSIREHQLPDTMINNQHTNEQQSILHSILHQNRGDHDSGAISNDNNNANDSINNKQNDVTTEHKQ